MDQPNYDFNKFVTACDSGTSSAFVIKGAVATARMDFNLNTQKAILSFIGNGGLESPQFVNTAPWRNNPDTKVNIMVDAYNFYSGLTYGYLAFFFQPINHKWIIKSFKKNDKPDTRNLPFVRPLMAIFGGKK